MPGEKLGDSRFYTGQTPYNSPDKGRGYDNLLPTPSVPVKAEFASHFQIEEQILKNGGFSRVETNLREYTSIKLDDSYCMGAEKPWRPKGRS